MYFSKLQMLLKLAILLFVLVLFNVQSQIINLNCCQEGLSPMLHFQDATEIFKIAFELNTEGLRWYCDLMLDKLMGNVGLMQNKVIGMWD